MLLSLWSQPLPLPRTQLDSAGEGKALGMQLHHICKRPAGSFSGLWVSSMLMS